MEAAKLGTILTKLLLNVSAISFLSNISVLHRDKIGKRGISDSFVSNNFSHNILRFLTLYLHELISLIFFSNIRNMFCIVYSSKISKTFHTIFVSSLMILLNL